jgi:hypothetical protein
VVSWNIINSATAGQNTLPRIVLPNIGADRGAQIPDPIPIAIKIDLGRIYALGATDLSFVVNSMDGGGRSRAETKVSSKYNIDSEDDDYDDGEYEEEPEEKKVELKTEDMGTDEIALTSAIGGCISPLVAFLGMSDEDLIIIAERVQRIAQGQITEEMKTDAYLWADRIGLIKTALQELHTRLRQCTNEEWLTYVRSVFELLHRVQLRQMRL